MHPLKLMHRHLITLNLFLFFLILSEESAKTKSDETYLPESENLSENAKPNGNNELDSKGNLPELTNEKVRM